MNIPFFTEQVELLSGIVSLRNEWLDPVFRFLNYFDSIYFIMVLIPAIWIGISYRWGLHVAILLIISSLVNYHLKLLFDLPRPMVEFSNIAMFTFSDPGFPSGGAQTSALLGGLLIYGWRSPWSWVAAVPYILLISFSRLYLGVHYPLDILGGWIVGLAILFAFIYSIKYIDKFAEQEGRGFCIIVSTILCFLYAFLMPSPPGYRLTGAFLGFTLGAYASLCLRLYPPRQIPRFLGTRIASAVVTILVMYGLYFLTPRLTPGIVQSFVLSVWVSVGAYPFCRAAIPKIGSKQVISD